MFSVFGMNGHRNMNCNRSSLPQSMNTIVTLFLNGGIPPSGEMKYVGCRGQREAYAGGLETKHEDVETTVVIEMPLETVDNSLALRDGRFPVDQINSVQPELSARQFNKSVLDLPMLDKNQASLALRLNAPQDVEGCLDTRRRGDEISIF